MVPSSFSMAWAGLSSARICSSGFVRAIALSSRTASRDLAAAAALYPFNPNVVERVMASYVDA